MTNKSAPNSQLKIEWVYGYRGFQCHDNLLRTIDNNIVYFIAGVGIVYNAQAKTQAYFLGHDDDIISLCLNADGRTVATGQIGKNPYICVWDSVKLNTISILKDQHTHGISSLAFSQDGLTLVSIGLDPMATMCVWNWKKGNCLTQTRAHSERVFDCKFHFTDKTKMVSCGMKHIKFWTISGNTISAKKGIFGKIGEIQTMLCVCVGRTSGKQDYAYSGTMGGDVYVWKENQLERCLDDVHEGAIYCIQAAENGSFVSGGKDGRVCLYDSNFEAVAKEINFRNLPIGYPDIVIRSAQWNDNLLTVGTLQSDIFTLTIGNGPTQTGQLIPDDKQTVSRITSGHGEGELWALAIHPTKPMFATASDDMTLKIWHMKDHDQISRLKLDHKIRSCGFNADGNLIAIGHDDGSFKIIQTRDMTVLHQVKERNEVLHELKFSPNGGYLAIGSNDNFVDIYDATNNFKKIGECGRNSSFITHLDWSKDSQFICTNSGSGEVLVFKAPTGNQETNASIISQIQWDRWTRVLGDEVNGIWPKYTDLSDINAADVNFGANVIATGDDDGFVKLMRFPSTIKGAHFKKYPGHSAHVTNIRWTNDGQNLISIGGRDQAIIYWKFLPISEGNDEAQNAFTDSNSEASDSAVSDINGCDSDIEKERQNNYERTIYKEDVAKIEKSPESRSEMANVRRKHAPSEGLKLEFVHGYRGYDCRNNLFYTQSGEIVYHVAAVGIVLNKESRQQRFYLNHTDDILCLALHPIKDFVATGQVGRDAVIHVWDVTTCETVSVLKNQHERGVCALDFSTDGKKLASCGLDENHCIVVWDWRKGEKLASTRAHKDKIFVIKWNPHAADQLVAVGVKFIRFFTQTGGGFSAQRGTYGNVSKLDTQLCVTFNPKIPDLCYSGGVVGKVYVWKKNILDRCLVAHEDAGCFAIHALDKGFVTGGKDGKVCLFNEEFTQIFKKFNLSVTESPLNNRGIFGFKTEACPAVRAVILGQGKILVGTRSGEIMEISKEGEITVLTQGHREGELWGLAVHKKAPVFVSASDDCTVRVWQVEEGRHRMLNYRQLKGPIRSCDISPDGKCVTVGFKDGSFSILKGDTLEDIESNQHRKEEISDVRFSPSGKYLAIASHDNFVDIYNLETRTRMGVCKGASSYITHIDWDSNSKLIMTNSGAKEQLFFESPRATRQNISKIEQEKINWASWTCTLGETCLGVWPPKSDVTDVNSTCLSSCKQLLATGDDFGMVKLFDYPSKTKFAKYKQYRGHSSHVTNVRWLYDDSYLVSAGGADTSLMVWKHKRAALNGGLMMNGTKTTENNSKGGESELSDTDSEEEGGFDSDVEREKRLDYMLTSAYTSENSLKARQSDKTSADENKKPSEESLKKSVSRSAENSKSKVEIKLKDKEPCQDLKLKYIKGYRGFDCRNNVYYLDAANPETIVYHAAGSGIVQDLKTGKQSFYLNHSDDIISLAINQHPKFKGIVATGQVGKTPPIHVWSINSQTLASSEIAENESTKTLSTLQGVHHTGICSLDFSSSGRLLLSVSCDEPNNTLAVWRWQEGQMVATGSGHCQRIFRAEFRPDSDSHFVTVGVKHVKFWTIAGSELVGKKAVIPLPSSITKQTGSAAFESVPTKMTTMLSIAFGTDNVTYTGSMSGDVWVWKNEKFLRLVEKAHTGPVFVLFTTLKDGLIVSGGKEKNKDTGSVKLWDQEMKKCKPFHITTNLNRRGSSLVKGSKPNGPSESESRWEIVRSLSRTRGKILIGTQDSNIFEIDEKSSTITTVMEAHSEGALKGLAIHPTLPQFATGSMDGSVRIWDITNGSQIKMLTTGPSVSVDFSQKSGKLLAVGLENGSFLLVHSINYRLIAKKRDRGKPINTIKFSPNEHLLAVASQDGYIDLYSITVKKSQEANTDANRSVVSSSTSTNYEIQRTITIKLPGDEKTPNFASSLDFSTDNAFIRVDTLNVNPMIYNVASGEEEKTKKTLEGLIWSNWTSVLGSDMIGIWPENAKKNEVNSAHVSGAGNSVVTGDDFGLVKLFQFPCREKLASFKAFYGHSAHVANVKFANSDQSLISIGGDDCCIFIWQCK